MWRESRNLWEMLQVGIDVRPANVKAKNRTKLHADYRHSENQWEWQCGPRKTAWWLLILFLSKAPSPPPPEKTILQPSSPDIMIQEPNFCIYFVNSWIGSGAYFCNKVQLEHSQSHSLIGYLWLPLYWAQCESLYLKFYVPQSWSYLWTT